MKVSIVNYYQGLNKRGGETFVDELSKGLSSIHQITVYSAPKLGFPRPPKWSILNPNHPLRYLFLDLPKILELLFTLRLLPILFKQKPDVIIPLNSGWQSLILSIYCRWFGAKLIIVGQSGPGWDDRWNLLMYPHLFVSLTKHNLSWAKKNSFWNVGLVEIPNGVDVNTFSPIGAKKKLNLKGKIVLCVAAPSKSKKIDLVVKAVSLLKNVSLLVLGGGELSSEVDHLGSKLLGVDRYMRLEVPHNQISQYIRACDLFTMVSSTREAFGIVYLEAMACGLGVVTRDDPSRREIVGNAGLFVDNPEDLQSYAQVIEQGLKKSFKKEALQRASKFSWVNIIDKYNQELEKLSTIKI